LQSRSLAKLTRGVLDRGEIDRVRALLGSLNDRERSILRGHSLGGKEQSLRDVGERLGLGGERVRQIEHRALGNLRAAATPGGRLRPKFLALLGRV
jgi:DNA-directed RNA polymerase sigma subunit (sigma70/sigma32)